MKKEGILYKSHFYRAGFILLFLIFFLLLAIFLLLSYEMKTSRFQAYFISKFAKELNYSVDKGQSKNIIFPKTGPYNELHGYIRLPSLITRLTSAEYEVESQSRFSEKLLQVVNKGFYAPYHEKSTSGISIVDEDNNTLFQVSYPERTYKQFHEIPDIIVKSLLFIENKDLLDTKKPYLNPSVEWDRLIKALFLKGRQIIDKEGKVPGGSTLSTQMEKFRHSPKGLTTSISEKYRQMASSSLRVYQRGEKTLDTRKEIILDYINSIPLGAIPGYGQINGIGDGMYGWYGVDWDELNTTLFARSDINLDKWAKMFKEVLSLFIAQRRPSLYLLENNQALVSKTDGYIWLLANNGIITSAERDALLQEGLKPRTNLQVQKSFSFVDRKAVNAIRSRLLTLLDIHKLYQLDRLDLTVKTSFNKPVQEKVTEVIKKLTDPEFAKEMGLNDIHLLEGKDPSKVSYSFTLYEQTKEGNMLRVQADNFDQPLNINEGVKIELGSSAKLRTLISYLEVVANLHEIYSPLSQAQLRSSDVFPSDNLREWAKNYFLLNPEDKSLKKMLNESVERVYSASPTESFFTGGGVHSFVNYDDEYDEKIITVREAFNHSVNLVFIRMMRDIVKFYIYKNGSMDLLEDVNDPRRQIYLEKFVNKEGNLFLSKFYKKYKGKSFEESMELALNGARISPNLIANVFRFVNPEATIEEFTSFVRSSLAQSDLSSEVINELYEKYAPSSFSLIDRGYLSNIHPLELWVIGYLNKYPQAALKDVIRDSSADRMAVYSWLFNKRQKDAQDHRIRSLIEVEAFSEIHQTWKRLGYPFDSLVPSYATAIGSSADKPASLAELVGIISNNGVLNPSIRVNELYFATGTPYETNFKHRQEKGNEVLNSEIAKLVKELLKGVVEKGTARRVQNAFIRKDGTVIPVGGKTGTGDNRFDIYDNQGNVLTSRAINRTATFVFFIGDRFFGTVTAYVGGTKSDEYKFTSGLPLQVLKILAPKLMPLVDG